MHESDDFSGLGDETFGRSTPLIVAVQNENEAVVAVLLGAGAAVNICNSDDGCTALFVAAITSNMYVVNARLAAGAEVNRADKHGLTPIFNAAEQGHEAVRNHETFEVWGSGGQAVRRR